MKKNGPAPVTAEKKAWRSGMRLPGDPELISHGQDSTGRELPAPAGAAGFPGGITGAQEACPEINGWG